MSEQSPASATLPLPVTRVALFASGVGYFEHAGTVVDDATTTLQFTREQINDVLKSLVVADLDGGAVTQVSYPSQDPLARLLQGFSIDLSDDPGLGDLLAQLRGSSLNVTASGEQVTGRVLGVESRSMPNGEVVYDRAYVNLLTPGGIRSLPLDAIISVSLADAALAGELDRALSALASARNADKKAVSLHFSGAGERRVRAGYVVATPLWKASYRLSLQTERDHLQGWAIVENQTDADWDDVTLALVSGRPTSFMMELYEPRYVQRPLVEPELFEGVRPPRFAEGGPVADMTARAAAKRGRPVAMAMAAPVEAAFETGVAPGGGVTVQAETEQVGELFEYQLSHVSLARHSSALVPIISEAVEVTRLSIFNQSVLARHPLLGARLRNATDKHLAAGPLTVFADGSYAGDAQVDYLAPAQERLISYGIDLAVLVDVDAPQQRDVRQTARFVRGVLEISRTEAASQTYTLTNKSETPRAVVLEHPRLAGWELAPGLAPHERTDELYRFSLELAAGHTEVLTVEQQRVVARQLAVVDQHLPVLLAYLGSAEMSEPVRGALSQVVQLRQEHTAAERALADTKQELASVAAEQGRLRENLAGVDKSTSYGTRLLTKLDAQETRLEALQAQAADQADQVRSKLADLEAFLLELRLD